MDEKNMPPSVDKDMDEKSERPITTSSSAHSSTTADLADKRHHHHLHHHAAHHKETDRAGTPDIDHEEIEAVVPGHSLDVELGKVSAPFQPHPLHRSPNPSREDHMARLGSPLGKKQHF